MNKSLLISVTAVLFTAVVTYFITRSTMEPGAGQAMEPVEKKPLYWVAPMDPDYRRDAPGKSPMGMDLIPVYDQADAEISGPGTVTISPDVVNNLGVRTSTVEKQAMKSKIITVGYVQYDEDQLVHIHPRVEGWIEKLFVKAAGDPVKEGEPLYSLYSPQLVNAQEELVLALSRNNARLIQAAEGRLRALQIDEAAIKQLKVSRKVQQTLTFYAPHSGVVDNLNIREGFFAKPGTKLMSVGSLDEVWVEAEIFERQATLVEVGLPVTMTLDYLPGKRWSGRVDYVYPTLNPQTRTVRVRLRFNNPDGLLKPNMFTQVEIHANVDENAMVVPQEAVIRTGRQDRVVLALGNGRFKSVAVAVGRLDERHAEIISGLEVGDRIVTSAQFLLDSESSKTSDFKRLHHGKEVTNSVWVAGQVKSVASQYRRATVSHEAIQAWEWPAMTMEFAVADDVDIAALQPGAALQMEITRRANDALVITQLHGATTQSMPGESISRASVNGVVNHIDPDTRLLNISREAIAKWNRPATTMNFVAAEGIGLDTLSAGDAIHFTFEIADGEFVVVDFVRLPPGGSAMGKETNSGSASGEEHRHD